MDNNQLTPQLQALLSSKEARQLIRLLTKNNGDAISQISQALQRGDEAAARELAAPLTRDPNVAALLQQLGGQGGKDSGRY